MKMKMPSTDTLFGGLAILIGAVHVVLVRDIIGMRKSREKTNAAIEQAAKDVSAAVKRGDATFHSSVTIVRDDGTAAKK